MFTIILKKKVYLSKRLDLHINLVDNSKTSIQINYYNGKE